MTTALAKGRAGSQTQAGARILIVSGPEGATEIVGALTRLGHEVQEADTVEAATAALQHGEYDLMFADPTRLTAMGSEPGIPVVLLGDEAKSTVATCLGAVAKTTQAASLQTLVGLVLDLHELRSRCAELETFVGGVRDGSAFVGRSPVMRRMQSAISRAADSDTTVLIEGERGSGKSFAARMIHCKSRRGNRALVVERGASLDGEAMNQAIARARSTTLIVEDVEQLPMASQQILVRYLKERSSAAPSEQPPARIIATTTAHLPELVARGAFREDLYYRLHVFPLVMPALRERTDDIPLLATALVNQCGGRTQARGDAITPTALTLLENMTWPGNVAQLDAVVRRALYLAGGGTIDREHLATQAEQAPSVHATATAATPTSATGEEEGEITEAAIRPFDEEEQRLLSRALRATRGNVRRAAQLLGIGRATLYRKIQQYRLRLQ